jgi:hypothetical protein
MFTSFLCAGNIGPGGFCLAVPGCERHAGPALGAQSASRASALAAEELVRDAAETVQSFSSLVGQRDARFAADFADARPAVRVNVERRVSRIAPGKCPGGSEMFGGLRRKALRAAVNCRGHVPVVPVLNAEAVRYGVHGADFMGVVLGYHDTQVKRDACLVSRSESPRE